jgi:predicted HicB family RNase H-like nuclease
MSKKEAKPLRKPFTVRIPEKLIERIKVRAVKEHLSAPALVEQAVESYLKAKPRESEKDEE